MATCTEIATGECCAQMFHLLCCGRGVSPTHDSVVCVWQIRTMIHS